MRADPFTSLHQEVLMTCRKTATALVAATAVLTASTVGYAAAPTQADFDVCNKEAQARVSPPAASPGAPETTPTSPSAPSRRSPSGGVAPSTSSTGAASDPALAGMATAGQSDPAYQQAYRECLKRRGF